MKFTEDSDFNELISKFKDLSIAEKKQLTITEMKNLIAVLYTLNLQNNSNSKVLFNRELIDCNTENCSEEDFVEAMYVYLYSIKESLADFISCFVDDFKQ